MTFDEQLQMLEDWMNYSDEVVDEVPQWYVEWWIKNHRKENQSTKATQGFMEYGVELNAVV
jgi:hypothetical protein